MLGHVGPAQVFPTCVESGVSVFFVAVLRMVASAPRRAVLVGAFGFFDFFVERFLSERR